MGRLPRRFCLLLGSLFLLLHAGLLFLGRIDFALVFVHGATNRTTAVGSSLASSTAPKQSGAMAKLVHEIWIEDGAHGPMPNLCLAGPDGDNFRKGLARGARLVHAFEAETNFEAMTIYYRHNGWGDYVLNVQEDQRPFPDAWLERQKQATDRRKPAAGSLPPDELENVPTDLRVADEPGKSLENN
jgi:hypothetical protein